MWNGFLTHINGGAASRGTAREVLGENPQILDVRSAREFAAGHATGSVNIPLGQLESQLDSLDRSRPVVVCCASGCRSAQAKNLLEKHAFSNIYDAGAWRNLLADCRPETLLAAIEEEGYNARLD